ncbi:hypothetical protein QBZ16_000407 [Prototheca wickerhamii]|uniref:FHA domain-containing protein n=1 Tax=Prototheca wickerhamii TaxID=3111 RepID=A0AAD9IL35_PROWI|nr:hypothetical protein QBZ16_000407 [Prototheca wickerhamii]
MADTQSSAQDLLTLRITKGPAAGSELVAQGERQILGRTRVARQLQIKDPNVSERHAEIFWDGKAWNVRDLGSSNGTEIVAALDDQQTVEQYLLNETERLSEAIRARAVQKSNELRNQWQQLCKPLFAS